MDTIGQELVGKDATINLKDEVERDEKRQTKGRVLEVGTDFVKVRFTEGRYGDKLDSAAAQYLVSYVPIVNIRSIHAIETKK